MKLRTRILVVIGISACIAQALVVLLLGVYSWWGGDLGKVVVYFNIYHERLPETILFTIVLGMGIWSLIRLIKEWK